MVSSSSEHSLSSEISFLLEFCLEFGLTIFYLKELSLAILLTLNYRNQCFLH